MPKKSNKLALPNKLWIEHHDHATETGRIDMLTELCRLDDRLAEIRTQIQQDGISTQTAAGRTLAHPLLPLEATFSSLYSRLLHALVTPQRGVGRPLKADAHDSELAAFRRRKITEHATKPN